MVNGTFTNFPKHAGSSKSKHWQHRSVWDNSLWGEVVCASKVIPSLEVTML